MNAKASTIERPLPRTLFRNLLSHLLFSVDDVRSGTSKRAQGNVVICRFSNKFWYFQDVRYALSMYFNAAATFTLFLQRNNILKVGNKKWPTRVKIRHFGGHFRGDTLPRARKSAAIDVAQSRYHERCWYTLDPFWVSKFVMKEKGGRIVLHRPIEQHNSLQLKRDSLFEKNGSYLHT